MKRNKFLSKNICIGFICCFGLLACGNGVGYSAEIDGLLIADYRNSYATPYGNTYSSRFGSSRFNNQYRHFKQNNNSYHQNYQPFNQSLNHPQYTPPPVSNPSPAATPAPYATSKDESGPVEVSGDGKTIKMEVSHSDYLPSLPEHLRKGKHFTGWSNTKVTKSKSKNSVEKFLIPEWLAGKWSRAKTTETKRIELPQGKKLPVTGTTTAIIEEAFGTYRDNQGRIWQVFDPKRATGQIDRGRALDHHRVMKYKIEILDPNTVVVEVTASHLVVSKNKHQIVQSYQDEELNTYHRVDKRKAKTESSVKVFDQLGKPILLTHSYSYVTKVQSAK